MSTLVLEKGISMPRSQKFQLTAIISMIGLIMALVANIFSRAQSEQSIRDSVSQAQKEIESIKPKVEEIAIVKNDVAHITKQVDKIEKDVQTILETTSERGR